MRVLKVSFTAVCVLRKLVSAGLRKSLMWNDSDPDPRWTGVLVVGAVCDLRGWEEEYTHWMLGYCWRNHRGSWLLYTVSWFCCTGCCWGHMLGGGCHPCHTWCGGWRGWVSVLQPGYCYLGCCCCCGCYYILTRTLYLPVMVNNSLWHWLACSSGMSTITS